jgi:hypothetical protein
MIIEDNGIGFDLQKSSTVDSGLGLIGWASGLLTARVDGDRSEPGAGTTIPRSRARPCLKTRRTDSIKTSVSFNTFREKLD